MDADDVWDSGGILRHIFKDSFPDYLQENPEFAVYLEELSSYGVEKLDKEPERLADERRAILEQTQDLAFHNYKTFIQTADCSREIFQDFQIIEDHVGRMLTKLPQLTNECSAFLSKAEEINTNRRQNSVTLQHHTSLLEVLELPQLMDTCVRNGYYEEAQELATHVRRMDAKHSTIPIINAVVADVQQSRQLMLSQLLQKLRSSIQLPECLRIIGYLRRMDVFSETELRIKFLQARGTWFQSVLDAISKDDPYYHISKTIEASRVHLFDIVTQYRAIFSDDDTVFSNDGVDNLLFHGWVTQKVCEFLTTLESDLSRGLGERLDSVLGQCMYFGLSFSRVSADFRGLLAPVFQNAVLSAFTQAVDEAGARFDESMQGYTLLGLLPTSAPSTTTQTATAAPPVSLLEFPPLANYLNGLLNACNTLRLCAPLSLAAGVTGELQASLTWASDVILSYHRAEQATFEAADAARFTRLAAAFCDQLVPHCQAVLAALFPPGRLAQALGLTTLQLATMDSIGVLDVEEITSSLQAFLPEKFDEPSVIAEISSPANSISHGSPAQQMSEQVLSCGNATPENQTDNCDEIQMKRDNTTDEPHTVATIPDSISGTSVGFTLNELDDTQLSVEEEQLDNVLLMNDILENMHIESCDDVTSVASELCNDVTDVNES